MVLKEKTGKIGLFDSGFGGLAIMRAVANRLPLHDYIYLGDSANNPYGPRTTEEVYQLTQKAVSYLFSVGCELVILACNTASCQALGKIQQEYLPRYAPSKRVLGVIFPAVEAAVQATQNNKIGVIATENTINSGVYVTEIQKLRPAATVYQQACPLLVPMIEGGSHASHGLQVVLRSYLQPLQEARIDTLILGCTHYELIKDKVTDIVGSSVRVVAEGPVVAARLADYLARHPELEAVLSRQGQRQFLCTQAGHKTFDILASEFYGQQVTAQTVRL
jgi:glutamate racemase